VDGAGNAFVLGNFNGSLNFGNGAMASVGNGDLFLTKLDPAGNALWSKHFGDATSNNIGIGFQEIIVDSNGAPIISGGLYGNADFGGGVLGGGLGFGPVPFVAKFDGLGANAWAYAGTNSGLASALSADHKNELVVSGNFDSAQTFAGVNLVPVGMVDTFLLKLTP
jgi:hypothetical protein